LIDGFFAECLLADRGYDSNKIIEKALLQNMNIVIPPKKNRRMQRDYDKDIYKLRHLVSNFIVSCSSIAKELEKRG